MTSVTRDIRADSMLDFATPIGQYFARLKY